MTVVTLVLITQCQFKQSVCITDTLLWRALIKCISCPSALCDGSSLQSWPAQGDTARLSYSPLKQWLHLMRDFLGSGCVKSELYKKIKANHFFFNFLAILCHLTIIICLTPPNVLMLWGYWHFLFFFIYPACYQQLLDSFGHWNLNKNIWLLGSNLVLHSLPGFPRNRLIGSNTACQCHGDWSGVWNRRRRRISLDSQAKRKQSCTNEQSLQKSRCGSTTDSRFLSQISRPPLRKVSRQWGASVCYVVLLRVDKRKLLMIWKPHSIKTTNELPFSNLIFFNLMWRCIQPLTSTKKSFTYQKLTNPLMSSAAWGRKSSFSQPQCSHRQMEWQITTL